MLSQFVWRPMVDKVRVQHLRSLGWTLQQIADDQHCTKQRVEQILSGKEKTPAQKARNVQTMRQRRVIGAILTSLSLGRHPSDKQMTRLREEAELDPAFAERHKDLLNHDW